MKNRKIWNVSFVVMIFLAFLSVYFIKSKNPYGAVISAALSIAVIYIGMKLVGIERSIKELRISSTTFEIYMAIILLWFVWRAGTLYGTPHFKEFITLSRNIITLAISIHLGVRLYYWIKGETK